MKRIMGFATTGWREGSVLRVVESAAETVVIITAANHQTTQRGEFVRREQGGIALVPLSKDPQSAIRSAL
jgi:hypothetical protein